MVKTSNKWTAKQGISLFDSISLSTKHIKSPKERYLLGQNTICEFSLASNIRVVTTKDALTCLEHGVVVTKDAFALNRK